MTDEPTPTPTETEPTPEPEPAPPPPQDFTATPTESLAEQVQRQSSEMPDSQSPTDVVPNRPMIRPAQITTEAEAAAAVQNPEPATEPTEPVVTETPVVTTETTNP